MHTNNIIRTQQVYIRNIYANTNPYMFAIIINEKAGHDFEGKQGGVYARVWSDEREGGSDIILFQVKFSIDFSKIILNLLKIQKSLAAEIFYACI